MTASLSLLLAYAVDQLFGEPRDAVHPVAWMGKAIDVGRRWSLRAGKVGQLLRGGALALGVPVLSAVLAALLLRAVGCSPVATLIATVLLLKPMFAVRALREAAFGVRDALELRDVGRAREALAGLCSRDARGLDAPDLAAAAIESVAENTSDSVVAPLFYFVCFGLPGAVFYRAVNTLDAMIGYHGRYEYVGKVAARADDLMNLVPARLTALLLLASGAITGADVRQGMQALLRDGGKTESPNAGRPIAAMAGLLGLRLVKAGHYALGDARRICDASQITAAWRIASVASVGAVVLAALAAGALHA